MLTRSGYATLTCVGAGHRNSEFSRHGYATVGTDGYGDALITVYFTLLDEILTGHIAGTDNGHVDEGEVGHIAEPIGRC